VLLSSCEFTGDTRSNKKEWWLLEKKGDRTEETDGGPNSIFGLLSPWACTCKFNIVPRYFAGYKWRTRRSSRGKQDRKGNKNNDRPVSGR
jgi:hypothetical protein